MTGPVLAQTATGTTTTTTTTAIQGISKSANGNGGGGTIAQAMARKIPLKSTYAASHISKAEIVQKSPVATLDSILNTEPSIVATSSGPLGVGQNITFRAFNSAQFSQTFDNINLNDIFNGGASNEASENNNVLITPQDIESVDLYRGINDPANNSYNSLAGTINYQPVLPSDTRGGSISSNYGSFGTYGYNALYNTGKIDGVSNVIAFNHQGTNGWLKGDTDVNSNLYDSFNVDTGSTGKVYGIFVYNHNNGEGLFDVPAPLMQKYGNDFQYPQSIYNNPEQDTNYLGILGTTQTLNSYTTFDIKGFFGTDDFTRNEYSNPAYSEDDTGYYAYTAHNASNPYTYYGEDGTELGIQPSLTFDLPYNILKIGGNLTSGTEHSQENYGATAPVPAVYTSSSDNNYLWDEHDSRTLYSVYIQDEIDLFNDRLKITPGVKYLYANTKSTELGGTYDYPVAGSVSSTAHFTSPTVGISYEFLPNTVIYGAYGQNIEFPTISGYYDNIDGENGQGEYENDVEPVHLQPEYVTDYEAGLRYSNAHYGFHGALGFYLEDFTNTFITETDPATDLSTTVNGGSSTYKGIELQLAEDFGHFHVNQTDIGDFTGYMNYSYNDAYYTNKTPLEISTVGESGAASASTVMYGEPVALVPRDVVSFGGAWSLDGWAANADARYVTSQYISQADAGTTSDLQEPAYFLLDLGVSKTVPLQSRFAKSVKFQFNIDNALNRAYDAYAYSETTKTAKTPGPYSAPAGGVTYASIEEAAPQAFYGSITFNF